MASSTFLPRQGRTRAIDLIGKKIEGFRWHQGDIVMDLEDGKSLILDTNMTFDEDGSRLDYEGTA
jgi:hypothetical protein